MNATVERPDDLLELVRSCDDDIFDDALITLLPDGARNFLREQGEQITQCAQALAVCAGAEYASALLRDMVMRVRACRDLVLKARST